MANRERAIEIATEAHAGQMRRDGRPYIVHPEQVMRMVAEWGYPESTQTIAILHDVLEDTGKKADDLRAERFREKIVTSVVVLTRDEGVDYDTYIDGVLDDPEAPPVKVADILSNLDEHCRKREVYMRALSRLILSPACHRIGTLDF